MKKSKFKELTKQVRYLCLTLAKISGKGHLGGTFSVVEILVDLYYNVMKQEDKLLIGKGHAAPAMYSILTMKKIIAENDLMKFGENGHWLGSQIDPNVPGVNYISGSLGNVLGISAGIHIANNIDGKSEKIYVVIGDGECEEGSIWESADFIGKNNLINIILIVDRNKLSVTDFIENDNLIKKFKAFGWNVKEINGHKAFPISSIPTKTKKPMAIIANTVKGKGVSFVENSPAWHNRKITEEEFKKASIELCKTI